MRRSIVAVMALAALSACSGEGQAGPATPTAAFEVPAGLELTEPGQDQTIGTSANVAYPDAADASGTVLGVGVGRLITAPRRDLALFSIPARTQPYYATVMLANRGPHPASFTDGAPVWLHLSGDTLLPPSTSTAVRACPGIALPEPLPAGRTVKGCLLFLVPEGTAVESVDFQPGDVTTAVRWTP